VSHNIVETILVRGYLPLTVYPLVVSLVDGLLARSFNAFLAFCWPLAGGGSLSFARNWREEVVLVIINYGRFVPHSAPRSEPGHPFGGAVRIRGALIQGIAKK